MTSADYTKIQAVLRNKKNIILQGAPGVGKTFAAKRLAWSMMGEIDESRVELSYTVFTSLKAGIVCCLPPPTEGEGLF